MPAIIPRPNLEYLPLPCCIPRSRITGFLLAAPAGVLDLLLAPLNDLDPGWTPAMPDRFMLAFINYPVATSPSSPWGRFSYNEFVVQIMVRKGDEICFWVPFIALDSFLPMLAGRDVYGMPKVIGRLDMGSLPFPSELPSVPSTRNFTSDPAWNMKLSLEVFATAGEDVPLDWMDVVEAKLTTGEPWIGGTVPGDISGDLAGMALPDSLMAHILQGFSVNAGMFIKQFPPADGSNQAVDQEIFSATFLPRGLHGIRFFPGSQVRFSDPASYPLASALGQPAGQWVNAIHAFCVDLDWSILPETGDGTPPRNGCLAALISRFFS